MENKNGKLTGKLTADDNWIKADERALFINEICTSNSVYVDEFREANDWIEIYNRSEKADDLGGMYISNDKNNLTMYQIPTNAPEVTSIDANGYKIIWMDKDSAQGPLHSNFKLNKLSNCFTSDVWEEMIRQRQNGISIPPSSFSRLPISVAISPGLRDTTRIPRRPYSNAHFLAYQTTKFLESEYANPFC